MMRPTFPADPDPAPDAGNGVERIEGIGPAYGGVLADAGVRTVQDLVRAEAARLRRDTGLSRRRLGIWQSAAALLEIPGMDAQLAEALVRAGWRDVRSVADADPMDLFGAIEAARHPRGARNIIPDDYERIVTPGTTALLQREAYWMVYGRTRVAPSPSPGFDFPPPTYWSPAHESNFGPASRSAWDVRFIVLHAMVDTLEGARRDMQRYHASPDDRRSAHYLVGRDGTVVQMVYLTDVAFHAANSGVGCRGLPAGSCSGTRSDGSSWSTGPCNCQSIGIEMEDKEYPGDPGNHRTNRDWATDELYETTAQLVRYLCGLYGIPRRFVGQTSDDEGILGHAHVVGRTAGKDDPQNFVWSRFMALVDPPPPPPPEEEKDGGKGGK